MEAENMTTIRRALRTWEMLNQWEQIQNDRKEVERWLKDNRPNKADVTCTHDKTA